MSMQLQQTTSRKMIYTLLAVLALCTASSYSAPTIVPPTAPVNEGTTDKPGSSLADLQDVMMDPAAKLRKFCRG